MIRFIKILRVFILHCYSLTNNRDFFFSICFLIWKCCGVFVSIQLICSKTAMRLQLNWIEDIVKKIETKPTRKKKKLTHHIRQRFTINHTWQTQHSIDIHLLMKMKPTKNTREYLCLWRMSKCVWVGGTLHLFDKQINFMEYTFNAIYRICWITHWRLDDCLWMKCKAYGREIWWNIWTKREKRDRKDAE